MQDHPTPIWTGQLPHRPIRTDVPGYPDTTMLWWPAQGVPPDVGAFVSIQWDNGVTLRTTFDLATMRIASIDGAALRIFPVPNDQRAVTVLTALRGHRFIELDDAKTLI